MAFRMWPKESETHTTLTLILLATQREMLSWFLRVPDCLLHRISNGMSCHVPTVADIES